MIIPYGNIDVDVTPSKIVAVARNYRAHAEEMGASIPEEPTIFLKPPSSLIGNNGVVILPEVSKRVEYEVELAAIMKTRCKKITPEKAIEYVLGYTVFVDVTARDLQAEAKKKGLAWTVAKGFDTFGPIGPKIVSADAIDPHNCEIWLKVNSIYKQRGNTKDMLFTVGELVSHISHIMTLEPTDIIATGTPEGVGPMSDGDVIEAGIQGIGVLKFTAKRE